MAKTKAKAETATDGSEPAGGESTQSDRLQAARQRVADLEAEQRELPGKIAAARKNREPDEWMRLLDRQDALPGELAAARRDLVGPELEAAWQRAEARHAEEQQAHQQYLEAARARDNFAAPEGDTREAAAERQLERVRLDDAVIRARRDDRHAHHATLLALADVEELEGRYRDQVGEEPPVGEGLRAPVGWIARTVVAAHPRSYHPDDDRPIDPTSFTAGTRPPRWLAHTVTNPKALVDEPPEPDVGGGGSGDIGSSLLR